MFIIPIICKENIIITKPATILSSKEFCSNIWPRNVEAAPNIIKTIEKQQGFKIACLEEIGFRNGWISIDALEKSGERLRHTSYGNYILKLIRNS